MTSYRLATTSSSPSPPSAHQRPDVGNIITIRQFHVDDAEQVHALLVEGLVYGADSPRNRSLRRYMCFPAAMLAFIFVLHSFPSLGGPRATVCLCTLAAAAAVYIHRSITRFFLRLCTAARATDMADIPAFYGVPAAGEDEVQRSGGFWVAILDSKSAGDFSSAKLPEVVVGYLGLKHDPASSSGTLRRMFVSVNHRRRGVGSMLLAAAMEHAGRVEPPLRELELETSEFQPVAMSLYAKHGFRGAGTRWMYLSPGPCLPMRMLCFRRKISTTATLQYDG